MKEEEKVQEEESTTELKDKETVSSEQESEENQEEGGIEEEESEEVSEEERLTTELAEAKDKYLRLFSEFENFRRRTAKEKLELRQTANEDLVVALLPVVDDFERALHNINEDTDVKSLEEGIGLIHQKMVKTLSQKGAEKIDTDKGADFDDEIHEAITQIPAPEEDLKGKVVDVVEAGYKLGDKVIRFAKVVTGA